MTESLTPTAQLALDTIHQKPVRGIPSWQINPMEHRIIDRLAGVPEGTYRQKPIETYRAMLVNIGTCLLDQWIPDNPLSMGAHGFEANREKTATTGAKQIVRDGMLIDSPEAVVAHLEKIVFPQLRKATAEFDEDQQTKQALAEERRIQEEIGPTMLKSGYGFIRFPAFAYGAYGYEHYFSAYALYPEVIERHFSLQADLALRINRAAARAFVEGKLPPLYRLDHDMAGSKGMMVNIKSLDRIWFPHFARCLEPMLKTHVRMIWHCDGNLTDMVPRLLELGISGFQGFQYEAGMDYERICRMKDRQGRDLVIIAGSSVTTTLPHGTPADVKREMEWLVRCGPKRGLFLGCSSSIAPGVPWENMKMLVEGFRYYREYGRS
jgi:hypothetical protein